MLSHQIMDGYGYGAHPQNDYINQDTPPYAQPDDINEVAANTLVADWQRATEKPTIVYITPDGTWVAYQQRSHTKLPRHTPVCLRLRSLPHWPQDTTIYITPTRRDDMMTDQQKDDSRQRGGRGREFDYDQIVFGKIGRLSDDESHPMARGRWGGKPFSFRYAPDEAVGAGRLRKTVNRCVCGMLNMKQDHHQTNHHNAAKKTEAKKRRSDIKAAKAAKVLKHTNQTMPPETPSNGESSADNFVDNVFNTPL
ncbi:unnamed protein product [Vitrella brassicaformis CCMP3155]|uniref:Uncharacterized protein n=1 Tax=Vitrella brassicaformis (strain CCMP3155) TaxID=1169540 RepID=A0A0G4FZB1_VITBC|nr:unnamed protein product [Vitrella brassicaformis CCMP3155]|eukprot:CEM20429.1 unnamed protein product [Vitrella brassicaformis CCMP3155]